MRIPDSTLSEIRGRLDIAEVIGETVALQRSGRTHWGPVPVPPGEDRRPSPSRRTKACSTASGATRAARSSISSWRSRRCPGGTRWSSWPRRRESRSRERTSSGTGSGGRAFLELYRRVAGSFHWLLMESPQGDAARAYLQSPGADEGDDGGLPGRVRAAGPGMVVRVPDEKELLAGVPGPGRGCSLTTRGAGAGHCSPAASCSQSPMRGAKYSPSADGPWGMRSPST